VVNGWFQKEFELFSNGAWIESSDARYRPAVRCSGQGKARVPATSRRHKAETFEPVTLGHIRSHGCRDLLVYCSSGRCHHSATMNADWLPDEMPVRSLCPRMVCTRCGMIGADVRPDWSPHVNKPRI
jgi:hypothetical protein